MGQLADALFTVTQQNVLGLLYVQPDKSFYTKEILRLTGMGVATIKRELDRMEAAGILRMTKIGNQHHYQANPECPIYDELIAVVRKTFGVVDVIREAMMPFEDQIDVAFIYGSIAKGGETASSDIDLLVVSESVAYSELMVALSDVGESLGRMVNPSIYSKDEIRKKLSGKNAFIKRILQQPKLWVKGSEDDIKKFRKSPKS